ncbi:MAG: cyclase family protein [Cyclobacteriaceae bacterium]
MSYIEISHEIENGMITYKGLPAPIICDYLSREDSRAHYDGETFHIAKIDMVVNTGTYIDCPFHRYDDGKQFTDIALSQLVDIPGVLVSKHHSISKKFDLSDFEGKEVTGKAVLLHSGWDEFWRQDQYFEDNPYLSEEAAVYLNEQGVKMVGIDSINIDDTRDKARPVHSTLLANDILIIEHLCNLTAIPEGKEFKVSAAPPKIKGVGSFPVRVYCKLEN